MPLLESNPHARWAILLLLGAALFLPGLGRRDLWAPDEGRYVQAAREMGGPGGWVVPHLNGEVYATKPPLHFWTVAASARAFGWNEFAVRLPTALAAIATLLAVFELGRRLVSPGAGWFAALAFGTAAKVQWQARTAQIDMALTLFVTLAILAWAVARFEDRPRLWPWFWVLAGIGTLFKGPVALVIPLLAVLGWLAVRRDRAGLSALRIAPGVAVFAAVVLAWLLPALLSGGAEYLRTVAFRETVVRYVEPWHAHHPWYFYLWTTPVSFLPWAAFLGSVAVVWKRGESRRARDALLLGATWVVPALVFFSLSEGKRDVYMVPALPGLALATGVALDRLAAAWPRWRGWLEVPLLGVAGCGLVAAGGLVALWPRAVELAEGDAIGAAIATGLLAALGLSALVGWILARSGRPKAAVVLLAAGAGVLGIGATGLVFPRQNGTSSMKPVGLRMADIPAGDGYALYGAGLAQNRNVQVILYGGRQPTLLSDPGALRAWAAGPGTRWVAGERDRLEEAGLEPPEAAALPSPPRWPWALCRLVLDADGRPACRAP